jgi:hypothetical protein
VCTGSIAYEYNSFNEDVPDENAYSEIMTEVSGTLRIFPTLVSHVYSWPLAVIIWSDWDNAAPDLYADFNINVVVDCASLAFGAIPESVTFYMGETGYLHVCKHYENDSAGVSWSSKCGYATISIEGD